MIKKIKNLIKNFIEQQNEILKLNREMEWADVYHDSIRGKTCLEKLPLNIGRWAGNYSFFYVLNRVLNDYKPKSILEFGLGESTKFISTYLDNDLIDSKHLVIEQDDNWNNFFTERFKLSERTIIQICPLEKVFIKGFESNSYRNIKREVCEKFDLYIIDGPHGSPHYSRYDILKLAEDFDNQDQFMIVVDDYNRKGEQETVFDLLTLLKDKNIKIFHNTYVGNKSVFVIATEKYKYITSL